MPLLLKFLGLKKEFYDLMETVRLVSDKSVQLNQKVINERFIHYVDKQLSSKIGKQLASLQ